MNTPSSSDVPELPPLSPDPVPEGSDLFWGHEGGGVYASAGMAPANNDPMLLGTAQYAPSSVAGAFLTSHVSV